MELLGLKDEKIHTKDSIFGLVFFISFTITNYQLSIELKCTKTPIALSTEFILSNVKVSLLLFSRI